MAAADDREKERFVRAFASAMAMVDKEEKERTELGLKYKRDGVDELRSTGRWNASYLATEFCIVAGGMSTLSARLRETVLEIGLLAKDFFDGIGEEEQ